MTINNCLAVVKIIISRIKKPKLELKHIALVWIFKQSRLGSEKLAFQRDLHIAYKIADRIVIHLDCFSA